MKPLLAVMLGGLLPLVPPAVAQDADPASAPKIERIEVQGLQYLKPETLLFYVSTKAGDRFDEHRLREDFRRVWETKFVDDLLVDVRDGATGKIVTLVVKERKRVQIVDYRGNKTVTTSSIEDKLKEKDAALKIDGFYDPSKAQRVEAIIREMLAEKGRPFATVKHDAKNLGGAGTQVSFVVDEGPKAKLKAVEFVGNQIFSDGRLRRTMRSLKVNNWSTDVVSLVTSPLSWGKGTYTEEKWNDAQKGDKGRLQDFYLNRGYVTASVGEPTITYEDALSGLFKKKPIKRMTLTIPVSEGDRYRLGEVKFEGMTVFKEENIRPLLKLKQGDLYRESRFKKTYDKLRDAYGGQGYFQWTVATDRKPDPEKKVVDVTIRMDEDKKYFVSKIQFLGNDTTRDKVIRREVYMNEGEVFNTEALKLSIRRINQLGYFKPLEGPPQINPSPLGDDKLDVAFKVQEQNRNQFTFGGGVSGLEGTFLNASFSTANFLGLGETFQVSAQSGKRTKNYQIAVTEPYLFDRPITAGIDLFSRRLRYEAYQTAAGLGLNGYSEDRSGASWVLGLPLGRFTRLFTNYSYQFIDIKNVEAAASTEVPSDATTPTTPTNDPYSLYYGQVGKRRESTFSPTWVHNTVDNPWTPRSGMKLTATLPVTGGVLGGTVDLLRPSLEAVIYIPHLRRTALGLRGEVAYVKPFGDTKTLAWYQRYYLGGETQIRGYQVRTVGPIEKLEDGSERGTGGNKYALFNAEYYIDVMGPLRLLAFFDAGQSFLEGEGIGVNKFRTSTGMELRFIMPVLNVPFRLFYAWNPHRDPFQPKTHFQFAVGTTF
ncbi:MAG TPA: outer membrane protein assembly factor BamA [Vicinamibacteria bacterium]|nr:outer membrane protein assembly factor BamA [Vicinamibacteria bacterium]